MAETMAVWVTAHLSVATFELNNALRLTKVTDANNKTLSAERVTQDSSVRIPLTAGMTKDASTTLTFEYEGILNSADESPVQGPGRPGPGRPRPGRRRLPPTISWTHPRSLPTLRRSAVRTV